MDLQYLLFLQRLREATHDVFSPFLMTASDLMVSLVPVCVIAFVFLCVNKRWGYAIMASIFCATIMNQLIKNIFCIYRPWIRCASIHPYGNAITSATGYSFPSGHATMASSFWGSFALIFRKHRWLVCLCIILAVTVAFSRNYIGVHTPQDVAVGLLEGSLAVFAVNRFQRINTNGRYDSAVVIGGLIFTGLYLTFTTLKPYPMDYASDGKLLVEPARMITDCYNTGGLLAGFLTGWFVEKRHIKMSTDGKWYRYLWRIILAIFLILLHTKLLMPTISTVLSTYWTAFFQCFILVWIITVIVPATEKWRAALN